MNKVRKININKPNKPTAHCHIQRNVDLSVLNIHVYL